MATTTATMSITSSDILSNSIAITASTSLNTAGTADGLEETSGLSRTNFTHDPIESKVIYRSDDAANNGANKVYLKNLSTTATEFFTIFIDQEEVGRLYAGDWAFFPWSAIGLGRETFIATIANTWAADDTWEFDGVEIVAASGVVADIAAQINGENFPNWTTTVDGAAVTFTARHAIDAGTVVTATADIAVNTAGDGDSVVTGSALGAGTESDIIIVPRVVTTMDLEHALFKQS